MGIKRRIQGIQRIIGRKNKGKNENQQPETLKNSDSGKKSLSFIGNILNGGKQKNTGTNKDNRFKVHELEPKVIKEINRQLVILYSDIWDEEEIHEKKDMVIAIMQRLFTKKERVSDCIAIARFLHFDKERVESFVDNFDKLQNSSHFARFAINGNVELLLNLYCSIDGLNELDSERFELTNEEINKIIDASLRDKNPKKVYNMFMYMKREEKVRDEYPSQEDLVSYTALGQLDFLITKAEKYKDSLVKAWHVFGTNGDIEDDSEKIKFVPFDEVIDDLMVRYKEFSNDDPIQNELQRRERIRQEKTGEIDGDIAIGGKIDEYIRGLKRNSLRTYAGANHGIKTSLRFRRSEIEEFEDAVRYWISKNGIDRYTIDIEKVYSEFLETSQTRNSLVEKDIRYKDVKRTITDEAKKFFKDKKEKAEEALAKGITSTVANAKRTAYTTYKRATANNVTKAVSILAASGAAILVFIGGRTVRNIMVDAKNAKAIKTESTIKMGATTIPGTIEPGFLESLYKEPEEIPENTTAVIYPNGRVELITDNGIKEINSNQAISFGISNDETNNKSYIKMGMTDNNAEIPLRDKNGEIIYNKKDGKAIKLLRSSNVIILPEEEIESGLNLLHVIETKTGNEGYVHHGDIPERTIEVQEYNIGDQNPTCYLIKTKDEVPVRETPSASKSYTENIKNTIGAKDEVMYHLAVEDKENEGFYKLLMFGENDSAYVSKKDVELAYVIQSDGAKKIEKEEEIDIYAEDETYEISEGKFAIGYTTIPNTIEEGFIFPSKTEIPEGSYVVSTSKTTTIMTKEGKKIKLKANNEYENSDKEKLGIKYLRTATICTPDGKGTPFLDENGKEKKDKNGNTLMLPERETVIIPPTVKNGEYYKVMDERGKVGNTKFVTDFELFEYDLTRAKIIVVNSGNCPLLKTAYYSSDYTGNFLTNTQGEQLVLTHKKPYIVEKDEESGFWKIIDKQFTREYYIPSEYISEIITITEDGIVEEKQEKEEKGEEPEI